MKRILSVFIALMLSASAAFAEGDPNEKFVHIGRIDMRAAILDYAEQQGPATLRTVATALAASAYPLLAPAGSASAPSYSYSANTNTGFYSIGSNIVRFSAGGTDAFQMQANAITFGSAGAFTWTGSVVGLAQDTGLTRPAAGTLSVDTTASGNAAGTINATIFAGPGTGTVKVGAATGSDDIQFWVRGANSIDIVNGDIIPQAGSQSNGSSSGGNIWAGIYSTKYLVGGHDATVPGLFNSGTTLKVRTGANGADAPLTAAAITPSGDVTCATNNGCSLGNGSTFFANAFIGTGQFAGTLVNQGAQMTAGADATVVIQAQVQRVVYKATVTATTCTAAFKAASLNADCVIATLPAKSQVTRVIVDNTAGWTCSATCTGTKTTQFGKTTGGTEYLVAKDVTVVATYGLVNADLGASLTTTATTPVGGGDLPSWSATTALKARFISGTGNWGTGAATNVNAGSTTFYIETLQFP